MLAAVGTTVGMLAAGTAAAATTAAPTVSVITPGFGRLAGGTTVNVFGHNFTQVHSVTFAGVAGESLDVVSSTTLTVRAPAHSAGPVSVRVHAAAGISPQVTTAVYHYTNKGAITGTVRAQSGLPGGRRLPNVDVVAFDQFGEYVTDTLTRITGDYLISGLPGSRSYLICFAAEGVMGGPDNGYSATGYADECYERLPWNGRVDSVPEGATQIRVGRGRTVTGVDAALPTAAGISGTVIAADDGTPVQSVLVTAVFAGRAVAASFAQTDQNGQYTLLGLRQRAAGYRVCFTGTSGTGGPTDVGYLDQCYDSTTWDGSVFDIAPDATAAPASAGVVTPNIDAALDSAATLSPAP